MTDNAIKAAMRALHLGAEYERFESAAHVAARRMMESSADVAGRRLFENSADAVARRLTESLPETMLARAMRQLEGPRLGIAEDDTAFAKRAYLDSIGYMTEKPEGPLGAYIDAMANHRADGPLAQFMRSVTSDAAGRWINAQRNADELFTHYARRFDPSWSDLTFPEQSFKGYAHLCVLSEAVHSAAPYSADVSAVVDSELGTAGPDVDGESKEDEDAAAIGRGMRPELLAFPSSTFGDVLSSVGFAFQVSTGPVPRPIEGDHSDLAFDSQHGAVLREVENGLRRLVKARLGGLAGHHWLKRRVNERVRKEWERKQQEARDKRAPVFEAIYYSDLLELRDVICQNDNWREAFGVVFGNRDDFRVSLERLAPIRNAHAHNRPLSKAQILILWGEAVRIFLALGTDVKIR